MGSAYPTAELGATSEKQKWVACQVRHRERVHLGQGTGVSTLDSVSTGWCVG